MNKYNANYWQLVESRIFERRLLQIMTAVTLKIADLVETEYLVPKKVQILSPS